MMTTTLQAEAAIALSILALFGAVIAVVVSVKNDKTIKALAHRVHLAMEQKNERPQ